MWSSPPKADPPAAEISPSPLITVVMATLNAAEHLPRSLGSLAGQELRDFEVVLVDGGSRDHTCEVAAELLERAQLAHRMVVLEGSGIYGAINRGVAEARGDWLYVMGADDCLTDGDVLASLVPHLRQAEPQVLVVHGDVWIEDPGYRYGQAWDLPRFLDRNISHQSAFYRRSAIQKLGIEYNEDYLLYADWDYNLRLFARGNFQHVPLLVASYGCAGASSRRRDSRFMVDKEANVRRYLGWRSIVLMPPHRFAMARGQLPGLLFRVQLLLNRFLWAAKRLLPPRGQSPAH